MPESTDPRLVELARAALLEITAEKSVGEHTSTTEGDGEVTLTFANRMGGYPGWQWTVSLSRIDGEEPTVLEAELMPGLGSLLAPDWVPWSERLAEYQAAQEAHASDDESDDDSDDDSDDADESDDDADDEHDDESDDDDDDEDDLLGSDVLHGGDLDGVDIDEHEHDDADESDESDDDDSDEDDDSEDDDSDDDGFGDDDEGLDRSY